jgi:hypothetical protein
MEENNRCNISQKTCPMDNCPSLKTLQDKYDEEFCKIVGEYERSTEPLKNRINECRKKSKVRLASLEQWRQEQLSRMAEDCLGTPTNFLEEISCSLE